MWTRELKTRVSTCSIRGVALHSKQIEDSWQKEGGLSKRFSKELCWQCSAKPWQLHERHVMHEAAKSTWRIFKRIVLTVQYGAAKVTRMTWRRVAMIVLMWAVRVTWRTLRKVLHETAKVYEGSGKESCWQCSMKPQNLQERLGEESLKWNWLGYILQK